MLEFQSQVSHCLSISYKYDKFGTFSPLKNSKKYQKIFSFLKSSKAKIQLQDLSEMWAISVIFCFCHSNIKFVIRKFLNPTL